MPHRHSVNRAVLFLVQLLDHWDPLRICTPFSSLMEHKGVGLADCLSSASNRYSSYIQGVCLFICWSLWVQRFFFFTLVYRRRASRGETSLFPPVFSFTVLINVLSPPALCSSCPLCSLPLFRVTGQMFGGTWPWSKSFSLPSLLKSTLLLLLDSVPLQNIKNKSARSHVCFYKHILHKLAALHRVGNTSFKCWAIVKTINRCLELANTNLGIFQTKCQIGIMWTSSPYSLPWTVSNI